MCRNRYRISIANKKRKLVLTNRYRFRGGGPSLSPALWSSATHLSGEASPQRPTVKTSRDREPAAKVAPVVRLSPHPFNASPTRTTANEISRAPRPARKPNLLRSAAPGARQGDGKSSVQLQVFASSGLRLACRPLFPHRCTCRPRWRGPWPRRVWRQTQHSHSKRRNHP